MAGPVHLPPPLLHRCNLVAREPRYRRGPPLRPAWSWVRAGSALTRSLLRKTLCWFQTTSPVRSSIFASLL